MLRWNESGTLGIEIETNMDDLTVCTWKLVQSFAEELCFCHLLEMVSEVLKYLVALCLYEILRPSYSDSLVCLVL